MEKPPADEVPPAPGEWGAWGGAVGAGGSEGSGESPPVFPGALAVPAVFDARHPVPKAGVAPEASKPAGSTVQGEESTRPERCVGGAAKPVRRAAHPTGVRPASGSVAIPPRCPGPGR